MTPFPPLKTRFHSGGLSGYPAYNRVTGYLRSTEVYKPTYIKPHVVGQPALKGEA